MPLTIRLRSLTIHLQFEISSKIHWKTDCVFLFSLSLLLWFFPSIRKHEDKILVACKWIFLAARFAAWYELLRLAATGHLTGKLARNLLYPDLLMVLYYLGPQIFISVHSGAIFMKRTRRRAIKYWRPRRKRPQLRGTYHQPLNEMETWHPTPLDAGDKEIRLLWLLPGTDKDEVCIDTESVSLCDDPSYIALSYVWGDPSTKHTVVVDGCVVKVSTNLFVALEQMRKFRASHDRMPLWIDALSINQDDPQERSEQVILMKTIFSAAAKVLIWLGPPSEESELALAKMKAVEAQLYISIQYPNTVNSDRRLDNSLIGEFEKTQGHEHDSWNAILEVFRNPWWKRTWVVQEASGDASQTTPLGNVEIILGRQMQTISFRSTLSTILLLTEVLRDKSHTSSGLDSKDSKVSRFQNFLRKFRDVSNSARRVRAVGNLRQRRSVSQYLFIYLFSKTDAVEQKLWAFKVWKMLDIFRQQQASDARDKVYAALPLALPNGHPGFNPDYALTIEQVYTQVVDNFIRYEKSLNILASSIPNQSDLPSFVVDWRVQASTSPLCRFIDAKKRPIYRACGRTRPDWTHRCKSSSAAVPECADSGEKKIRAIIGGFSRPVLYVQGIIFDKIAKISPIEPNDRRFRRPTWENLLLSLPQNYDATDEPLGSAYQRLLRADVQETKLSDVYESPGQRFQRALLLSNTIEREVRKWLTQADKLAPSHSYVTRIEEEFTELEVEITHVRGAKVEADLDLRTPWHDRQSLGMELNDRYDPGLSNAPEPDTAEAIPRPCEYQSKDSTNVSRIHECQNVGRSDLQSPPGSTVKHRSSGQGTRTSIPPIADDDAESSRFLPYHPIGPEIPDSILEYKQPADRSAAEGHLRELLSAVTRNRILCVTERGYIGLVPSHAEVGDCTVVLFGGLTPFVLRQVDEMESKSPEAKIFKLVGEAYVHGIMDGEMVDGLDDQDLGRQSEYLMLI